MMMVAVLALIGILVARPPTPAPVPSLTPTETIVVTSPPLTIIAPSVSAPAPMPTVTLAPTRAPLVLQPIVLDAIANASLNSDYAKPAFGEVPLSGITFTLGTRAFKSQAKPAPNNAYPTRAVVEVNVANIEQIYVLISAGDAFTRWYGKTVGRITLVFETGASIEVDLVLGQNLREWHAASNVVSTAPQILEVWQGPIAGTPELSGTLDMLTIEVPVDRRSAKLTQIELDDLSAQTVGSQDPSITVTGVTVAHR